MPERIQRKRTKGWKMPENTVSVDRNTIFGNPFPVSKDNAAKDAVRMFRKFLKMPQSQIMKACRDENGEPNPIGGIGMIVLRNQIIKRLPELRGKNLACWCKVGEPCHAEVLLELANK